MPDPDVPDTSAPPDTPPPGLRVLVVNDDPAVSRLLRARLRGRGYVVETAAGGEEGLARIEEFRPDLLFLAVAMPDMSGLEVLARVRHARLGVAVIMTAPSGLEQVAFDALRRGADDSLREPFEPAEFSAVLDRTVARLLLSRRNAELRRRLDAQQRQLDLELTRAREIQARLLPRETPAVSGVDLAARCVPGRDGGCDFYDWHVSDPRRLTLALGDVPGQGTPAALLMAAVRAALRAVWQDHTPGEALTIIDHALEADLSRANGGVTVFHAQLDPVSWRLRFAAAGHGHVFLSRAAGGPLELLPRGPSLGAGLAEGRSGGEITLDPGDTLVVYSDGLLQGLANRRLDHRTLSAAAAAAPTAEAALERLVALAALPEPPPDDVTLLVLRRAA